MITASLALAVLACATCAAPPGSVALDATGSIVLQPYPDQSCLCGDVDLGVEATLARQAAADTQSSVSSMTWAVAARGAAIATQQALIDALVAQIALLTTTSPAGTPHHTSRGPHV